jgi:hypothetical protein
MPRGVRRRMTEYKYAVTDIVGVRKMADAIYLKMADDEILMVDLRIREVLPLSRESTLAIIVEGFGFVDPDPQEFRPKEKK